MGHGSFRAGCCAGMLILRALFLFPETARAASGEAPGRGGFAGLEWGATVEQAERSFPDLKFKGYRMVDEKKEPCRAYARERTEARIESVLFESLEYWFQEGRFREVRAVFHSAVGPRTLVTEAERSYGILTSRLSRRYGKPAVRDEKYLTGFLSVVKQTLWSTDGVTIRLTYTGADRMDIDRISFEARKEGGGR